LSWNEGGVCALSEFRVVRFGFVGLGLLRFRFIRLRIVGLGFIRLGFIRLGLVGLRFVQLRSIRSANTSASAPALSADPAGHLPESRSRLRAVL
jgi:hypothetical protein